MHQAYMDSENIDAETCDEAVEVKSHDVKVELKASCFQGPPGPKGKDGIDGFNGSDGKDGIDGIDGADGADGNDGKSAYEIAVDQGFIGSIQEWLGSLNGRNGVDGVDGLNGISAYEVAVQNGYEGTQAEWLYSLKGNDGVNGKDGLSAFELALLEGFSGDITEWLSSLRGSNGEDGKDGKDGESSYEIAVSNGFSGSQIEWLESLKGGDGKHGVDGANGLDGKDGKSAYQLAVDDGFVGSVNDWLNSLKGADGQDADPEVLNQLSQRIDNLIDTLGDYVTVDDLNYELTLIQNEIVNINLLKANKSLVDSLIEDLTGYRSYVDLTFAKKSELVPRRVWVGSEPTPRKNLEEWVHRIQTNSDGWADASFSQCNFAEIVSIQLTAYTPETTTAAGNAAWASIFQGSVTNTGFRFRTKGANSAGLLAAMVAVNVSALVEIRVLGVPSG